MPKQLISEIQESDKKMLQEIQFTDTFTEESVQPNQPKPKEKLTEEEEKKRRLLQER